MSTTPQDILKRQLDFTNVSKYHEQGVTGKGIVIVNTEAYPGNDGHGEMTTRVLKEFAPDAFVINSQLLGSKRDRRIYYNKEYIELEDAIKRFNIKLFTNSLSTSSDDITLSYYKELQEKYGVIFFSAAGNDGDKGLRKGWHKNDVAIAVGAAYVKKDGSVDITNYSAIGDEIDFIAFMGSGSGTSAASPALTGMTALLLQKYGDFNQKECVEVLKSIAVDLGQLGKDPKYGWGLPVLPLEDELKIIIGGTPMTFIDVEDTRWSKSAIDFCVEKGLMIGFEDGTFRPAEPVTREQIAVILERLINL